jgi:hypothetical protein
MIDRLRLRSILLRMNILPRHYVTLGMMASILCLILGVLQYASDPWWNEKSHRAFGKDFYSLTGSQHYELWALYQEEHIRSGYAKYEQVLYILNWPGQKMAEALAEMWPRSPFDHRALSIFFNLCLVWGTIAVVAIARQGKYRHRLLPRQVNGR